MPNPSRDSEIASSTDAGDSPAGEKQTSLLFRYFHSGYAFLAPYIVAYLLYAYLALPVNSRVIAIDIATGSSMFPRPLFHLYTPSLFHVYWALHCLHLILGATVLVSAYKVWSAARKGERKVGSTQAAFVRFSPWLCLALLYLIPGVYLEWPSDPWEHIRRINEWRIVDNVLAHSSWMKSSYFLSYSFLSICNEEGHLICLNLYYTALSLLLSWQYYRLARSAGLGERASFIFVLLHALTFGNGVFSFTRYYGLSSSVLAQLGAVTLIRIVIECLVVAGLAHKSTQAVITAQLPMLSGSALTGRRFLQQSLGATVFLLVLIGLNHVQGFAIAALGAFSAAIWWLRIWRPASGYWLLIAAVVLSFAAVSWYPRHPEVEELYVTHGWLTPWYAFDLFSATSPAHAQTLQVIGLFGILNLFAGLILIWRNHVVGWLTATPFIMALLPCFALPLCQFLATTRNADSIGVFARVFFAVPQGLALVTVFSKWIASDRLPEECRRTTGLRFVPPEAVRHPLLLLLLLLGLIAAAGNRVCYDRFWHTIAVTPRDLTLQSLVAINLRDNPQDRSSADVLIVTPPLRDQAEVALGPSSDVSPWRQVNSTPNLAEVARRVRWLQTMHRSYPHGTNATSNKRATSRFLTEPGTLWIALGGESPRDFVASDELTLSNPEGLSSHSFTSSLIPLDRRKRYNLCCFIRQSGDANAPSYLAVAWYDKDANLLVANASFPQGAGGPLGWTNGTYSYFGLIGMPAPKDGATYAIAFGMGEWGEIPENAEYMRVGALLNYHSEPKVRIELSKVVLIERPQPERLILAYTPRMFSPASFAAVLSRHWIPSKVHIDYAGTTELREADASDLGF